MHFDDFMIKHKCDIFGSLQKVGSTICIEFHEQCKHLRKVPLQQKGWKTLD